MNEDLEKRKKRRNPPLSDGLKKIRDQLLLNYDKKRHLELLEQQSEEFKSDELLDYNDLQIGQLQWEIRDQYLQLLESYTKGEMDILNFRIQFRNRHRSIPPLANLLLSNKVLLSINKNSYDFDYFLLNIESRCEWYSNDPEPFRNKYEIDEVEFQISIEEIYLEIQNLLKEE